MNRITIHILFVAAVLGIGIAIGLNTVPGEWYASLAKPAFNPPNWVFGPAWSILYVLIGLAGARTFLDHRRTPAMRFWIAQMLLNFAWTPLFFGMEDIVSALIVIVGLLIAILGFIATSWRQDRIAALLFLPYAAWVAFATLLNTSIFLLN